MSEQNESPSSDAKRPEDRSKAIHTGPRARWTELIRRHAARHQVAGNLLKATLLVYLFLAAINMMGVGIRQTAINPEYAAMSGDAERLKAGQNAPKVLPRDLTSAERDGLRVGVHLMALTTIGRQREGGEVDGLVAYEDRALPAVLVGGLPEHKATVKPGGSTVAIAVDEDRVVVEPVCEYRDWLYQVFTYAKNPFLALLVGILVTAVFQSSSFTTSFTVGLVATIDFPLDSAIPLIMGANIGTSVTCVIVSLGYVRRQDEFRRAFAGATIHDFFKLLTVVVLFPLELIAHPLQWSATQLADMVYHGGQGMGKPTNFIKEAVHPVVASVQWVLEGVLGLGQNACGIVTTLVAVALLFVALLLLVKVLQRLVLSRAEGFFDRVLFRNAGVAFFVGLVLTAAVQSSSVTTSLAVPLLAAGLLSVRQVFPYFLGASIGTTVTALVAAFATGATTEAGARAGLTLAYVHLLFNCVGSVIFYPLRWMPIWLAELLGRKASQSKWYAIGFVIGVFFIVPLLGILVHWLVTEAL